MMTTIYAGLSVGGIYALVALSYNILLAASGFFNFAVPQFIMLGAFGAYYLVAKWHIPFVGALAILFVGGGLVGVAEEFVAIRWIKTRGIHTELVTTVGAAVAMLGFAYAIFGAAPQYGVPFVGGFHVYTIFGGRIALIDITLIVTALVAALLLRTITLHTRWGLAGRAVTIDPEAAQLRGVSVRRVIVIGFFVSGGFAAAAALVIAPVTTAVPDIGFSLAIVGFVALAVGGFGSYVGCALGGLIVGLVQAFASRYLASGQYAQAFIFALLLVVLMVKPTGLLGSRRVRSV